MRVIGLMSGTSHDAVDAAAADLTLDGDRLLLTPLGLVSEPYPEAVRRALAAALPPAATTLRDVCRLDTAIGRAFAAVAVRADRERCAGRAELVVSPGQTVYHGIEDDRVYGTLQLGQPAWIAEATGHPVVSNLRASDVAAGGQGAPLVSLFDVLWLRGRPGTPVALNLGGIANLTVAPSDAAPVAFDTGPGNALLDAAAHELTGGRLDRDVDGALAARGTVDRVLLDRLWDEPYYRRPAPKTTGKELFHLGYLRAALADRAARDGGRPLAAEDVLATLSALTAGTVAEAVRGVGATEVIASGGGVRNPHLVARLTAALAGIPLRTSDDLGVPSAAKEAYAFAVLGYLTCRGVAGTLPGCTGARRASVLGSLTPGRRGLPAVRPAATPPSRLWVATDASAGA